MPLWCGRILTPVCDVLSGVQEVVTPRAGITQVLQNITVMSALNITTDGWYLYYMDVK